MAKSQLALIFFRKPRRVNISVAKTPTPPKRKPVEDDVAESNVVRKLARTSSDFSVSTASNSKYVTEISDTNPGAKFIKIFNWSNDKVSTCNVFYLLVIMYHMLATVVHSKLKWRRLVYYRQ